MWGRFESGSAYGVGVTAMSGWGLANNADEAHTWSFGRAESFVAGRSVTRKEEGENKDQIAEGEGFWVGDHDLRRREQ